MTDLTENPIYEPGIYQLELLDPVVGGPGGTSNAQAQQLANRTAYLKAHVDALETAAPNLATQNYVAEELAKLDAKQSVRLATTSNITLSGTQTIDGVTGVVGDRVLVKNQTTASQNGIYLMAASGWSRAADASTDAKVSSGMVVHVSEGALHGGTRWKLVTPDPIVLGTTNLTYQDIMTGYAPLASPTFTGNPTAPTPTSGDADTSLATTAFADNMKNGIATVDVSGSSNVTLTAAQAGCGIIVVTGALTGAIELRFPTARTGQWVIDNRATGSFNITAKYATGSGVVLPVDVAVVVFGDATNVDFAGSGSQASFKKQDFAPSAGTTTLVVTGGYTPGNIQVIKNGVMLGTGDYTATTSPNITLTTASIAGDKFTVYAFSSFQVANAVQKSGDTMGGALALAAGSTAPNPTVGTRSTALATMQMFADEFVASLASPGYQKLPSGLIIQWGTIATAGGAGAFNATLPIPYPTAHLVAFANAQLDNSAAVVTVRNLTTVEGTAISDGVYSANGVSIQWLSIGY